MNHKESVLLQNDHRKLGELLELFFFHESAPGMPYWLPKGLIIKNLLAEFWRQYHRRFKYQEISSPLLNKEHLWKISGHLEHYKENMYCMQVPEGEEPWLLKPMNCANAMVVWKHKSRSYRELPLRLSDMDILHRNEASGALLGLFRSRCFCQDDAHNFVAEDQIAQEIEHILEIVRHFYSAFGLLQNVSLFLASRPDDFMGEPALWDRAESELHAALGVSGLPYGIKLKEGAFYGPKIDIQLRDCYGRDWQCGTIQLDFQLPRRFGLEYRASDGNLRVPVVVHRAVYGSIERFLGIVLEHFEGRLPFWCAPVQVKLLEFGAGLQDYRAEVEKVLGEIELSFPIKHNLLRYDVDARHESAAKKIFDAKREKVSLLLIIGAKEVAKRSVMLQSKDSSVEVSLDSLAQAIHKYADRGLL